MGIFTMVDNRPIIGWDLDGVLIRVPRTIGGQETGTAIHPLEHWQRYWEDYDAQRPRADMFNLYKALSKSEMFSSVIITARLSTHARHTQKLLGSYGIHTFIAGKIDVPIGGRHTPLICRSEWNPETSGVWKRLVIETIHDCGGNIILMIEDHKQSADEIRLSVPVLLYEARRGVSQSWELAANVLADVIDSIKSADVSPDLHSDKEDHNS